MRTSGFCGGGRNIDRSVTTRGQPYLQIRPIILHRGHSSILSLAGGLRHCGEDAPRMLESPEYVKIGSGGEMGTKVIDREGDECRPTALARVSSLGYYLIPLRVTDK